MGAKDCCVLSLSYHIQSSKQSKGSILKNKGSETYFKLAESFRGLAASKRGYLNQLIRLLPLRMDRNGSGKQSSVRWASLCDMPACFSENEAGVAPSTRDLCCGPQRDPAGMLVD